MKRQVIIDGDILVYEGCHGTQASIDWEGDGEEQLVGDLREATARVDETVQGIASATGAEQIVVALSDGKNFRKTVSQTYKANRKDKPKPGFFTEVRAHLRKRYTTLSAPWLEADDVMGIRATARPNVVIATVDKDLLTVPGLHYNWRKSERGVFEVKAKAAAKTFFAQVLTGDTSDGYPGLPGIGQKKAERILEDAPEQTAKGWWTAVCLAFGGREEAVVQARLAFILRASYYRWDTGQIKLWGSGDEWLDSGD